MGWIGTWVSRLACGGSTGFDPACARPSLQLQLRPQRLGAAPDFFRTRGFDTKSARCPGGPCGRGNLQGPGLGRGGEESDSPWVGCPHGHNGWDVGTETPNLVRWHGGFEAAGWVTLRPCWPRAWSRGLGEPPRHRAPSRLPNAPELGRGSTCAGRRVRSAVTIEPWRTASLR